MSEKVILILVAGMRPDGMMQCGHPFAEKLLSMFSYALDAQTVFPSVTLPCHMSLFHSVTPDRHGILTNTYVPQVRPVVGLFEQLDRHGKKCAFFNTWEELRDLSRPGHLHTYLYLNKGRHQDSDRKITDAALRYIREETPDFLFLYLGMTDAGGHNAGWMSEAYLNYVHTALDCIQRVHAQMPEGYTLIVTSDHGGHGRGHGSDVPEDMTIPLCCCGPSFPAGKKLKNASILDIAVTVAKLLDVPPVQEWEGQFFKTQPEGNAMPKFYQNQEITYIPNPMVKENVFLGKAQRVAELPCFASVRDRLPIPQWEGQQSAIDCYYRAWELAFSNLHNPKRGTKFVSPFIDAAFNGCLFMWDSVFMLMFGKYAHHIFNFQQTLDNFYAHQHRDGFISREISESDDSEKFTRFDPSSTGPNLLPWCEWEYYLLSGDKERLMEVFPPLIAYHRWLRRNRTWPSGGYFTSGWGCGMDNQPRLPDYSTDELESFDHGHMVWVDACMHQLISCHVLIEMAKLLERDHDVEDMMKERERLARLVNDRLWDEETHYYYDLWQNGQLNGVKSIAGYWALLADVIPKERLELFVAHLDNEKEFKRPNRVPTLSADHSGYHPEGYYWRGSVWAPTNYMVLRGLRKNGFEALAFDIAVNALENVVKVYQDTGTLWENYAPESAERGSISRKDFVGWTGIFPITTLIEYVFGIEIRADAREIIWNIRLTEAFGISQLPFGMHGLVDLHCAARKNADEKPEITVRADEDLTLTVRWGEQQEIFHIEGTKA